jgi:hypothetical protein
MSGRCIVFGGVFLDDPGNATCSNAAVVIDRQSRLAGVRKRGQEPFGSFGS